MEFMDGLFHIGRIIYLIGGGFSEVPTNIFACFRVGLPVAGVGTVEDKVAA